VSLMTWRALSISSYRDLFFESNVVLRASDHRRPTLSVAPKVEIESKF